MRVCVTVYELLPTTKLRRTQYLLEVLPCRSDRKNSSGRMR